MKNVAATKSVAKKRMFIAFILAALATSFVLLVACGTPATESVTLQGFFIWRALDIGGSAAIAYLLLFIVTIVATAFANLVRNRVSAE